MNVPNTEPRPSISGDMAADIRTLVKRMTLLSGGGHVGGSFSIAELLSVLYSGMLIHDPARPDWKDRDRLILSKGHCALALYAALAIRGFFPIDWLDGFGLDGRLMNHPNMHSTPGIEASTGSLGQGLSMAAGMSYAARMHRCEHFVFCVMGDGECHEGQVWEAAMTAGHFELDGLIAIIDRNGLCVDGQTEVVMRLDSMVDKWTSFGWSACEVDGHDCGAIEDALTQMKSQRNGRPKVLICKTVKGYGLPEGLAGEASCHYISGAWPIGVSMGGGRHG